MIFNIIKEKMNKSTKKNLYLTIAILFLIIIILTGIILNINIKLNNQEVTKEQLEEVKNENAYITLKDHYSELDEKQQEINNIQNTSGQATATADKILKDYTVYKNGQLITGTMENKGALNWSPSTSTSYIVPAGYYSGGTLNTANAYNTGYAEGLKQASTSNAEIQYTYHTHISECYTAKSDSIVSYSEIESGYYSCNNCGGSSRKFYRWHSAKLASGWTGELVQCTKCGCYYKSSSPSSGSLVGTSLGTYSALTCTKTTSTIESAQIVFK